MGCLCGDWELGRVGEWGLVGKFGEGNAAGLRDGAAGVLIIRKDFCKRIQDWERLGDFDFWVVGERSRILLGLEMRGVLGRK